MYLFVFFALLHTFSRTMGHTAKLKSSNPNISAMAEVCSLRVVFCNINSAAAAEAVKKWDGGQLPSREVWEELPSFDGLGVLPPGNFSKI